jgi:CRISPR-associated protein Csm4
MGYGKLRLLLEFETPYVTPLLADTLFGEFCWVYRWLKGEGKLRELLSEEKPVGFSDLLPKGKLPFPKFPHEPFYFSPQSSKDYENLKKLKKKRFLKKEVVVECMKEASSFKEFLSCVKERLLKEEKEEKKKENEFEVLTSIHVAINRITGTAYEGKLYHLKENFLREGEIYVVYNTELLAKEDIEEVFKILGLTGIGAKKSSGKGKFKVKVFDWDVPEPKSKEWFISLSTGLPEAEEVREYYADFFTKFPRHGREVASPKIFKKPVILSAPGSVFRAKEPLQLYGKLKEGVSPFKGHKHSFLVVPLFVG